MNFLRRLFGGRSASSAQKAKTRLQWGLIHDRTDISPQLLESLRVEMIAVLTKYMDIDESKIKMKLDHDECAVALVANVPVLRVKRGAAGATGNNAPENKAPEGKALSRSELLRNHNVKNKWHK